MMQKYINVGHCHEISTSAFQERDGLNKLHSTPLNKGPKYFTHVCLNNSILVYSNNYYKLRKWRRMRDRLPAIHEFQE